MGGIQHLSRPYLEKYYYCYIEQTNSLLFSLNVNLFRPVEHGVFMFTSFIYIGQFQEIHPYPTPGEF